MFMAIAKGRPYQTLNSVISGTGAPTTVFRPIEVNVTPGGTASASAYQTQLTRQRVSRAPMARSPATPSRRNTTISAATQDARREKALPEERGPTEEAG